MAKMTITEALAELKTIDAKAEKKQQWVLRNLSRPELVNDPIKGGSEKRVRAEMQAIKDLFERKVRLRNAIAQVNQTVPVTIGSITRTVAEWLWWRREVSQKESRFYDQLIREQQKAGHEYQYHDGDETQTCKVIHHLDQVATQEHAENLVEALGTLDGKLSLLNATVFVEV